jgi:hypothetical protein
MSPKIKGALVLTAVFALGGITGGGVTSLLALRRLHALIDAPPSTARARVFMAALDRDVHLDREQRERIRHILKTSTQETRDANKSCIAAVKSARLRTLDEVRAALRADQQPGFDRFRERVEKRAGKDDE